MAVTGFWPVFKNLKATLDYADNPDKTTAPEYLDEDLCAALCYAWNDDKTDRKMFVGGINCSAQNAYAEMIAVQRRFGLRGKVVGYHGIQSFREGEVTPEQAFAIGKETARKMWGDRYQVLVTVHLNTDNVHCHFVVNPVSFKDGSKFKNKIGDHKELRKISDEICREHELSVLENSNFYSKGKKREYWVHKAGKKTHRDYLREDVEYCLSFATSPKEFESQLFALGYTLDPVRFSVKAKHWERAVRLNSMGFSKERVNEQLRQNAENRYRLFTLEYRPPYKPKKFPLEDELRKLGFSIEHSYDTAAVLVDAVFYLVITVIQIVSELADVMLLSPDLRAAERDLKELVTDYHFLQERGIHTVTDLQANIEQSKAELSALERERSGISNRIRRPKSPEEQAQNKEHRKAVSGQMKPVREHLRRAERILEKSPHLYELLNKSTSWRKKLVQDTKKEVDEMKNTMKKPVAIPVEKLRPFAGHPFKVKDDDEMNTLIESIQTQGILSPLIVRPIEDTDEYEVISGHRRLHAAQKAGISEVPALIYTFDRDAAAIAVVDSNLHREHILPSEKAFAYKLKIEALSHQGKRTDLTSTQPVAKLRTADVVGEALNESRETVRRFIRLTYLVPEFLEKMDKGEIALSVGVELSYLDESSQREVLEQCEMNDCTPSYSQAWRMHKADREGTLTTAVIQTVMSEEKSNQKARLIIPMERIRKYFPQSYTAAQIEDAVVKLCERDYRRRTDRER